MENSKNKNKMRGGPSVSVSVFPLLFNKHKKKKKWKNGKRTCVELECSWERSLFDNPPDL